MEASSSSRSVEPEVPSRRVPAGMLLRMLMGLSMVVGLMLGLHVYLGVRLVAQPGWGAAWQALGWLALGLLFLSSGDAPHRHLM